VVRPFSPRAIALELASRSPEAALPCPACAASVTASRLERHLEKVHPGVEGAGARWAGVDRAVLLPAALAGGLCFAAFFAAVLLAPAYGTIALWAFAVVFGGVFTVFGLALAGRLRAELILDGDALELRYALGLGRRRLRLPPRSIELGTLLERRSSTMGGAARDDAPTWDVRAGSYLRLSGEGGSLTLGSKTGTGFRKHWRSGGWSAGRARRRWDILLAPGDLVAVEYLLAARGALGVRDA
jgi:hypothetical protein